MIARVRQIVPVWLGTALAVSAVSTVGQLPAARLDAIFPAGAAPQTTVEVIVSGVDLDDVSSLVFSHPGITATIKQDPPGPFDQGPQPVADTFVVAVAANVPSGHYSVRCQGRYGLSNARTFVVDPLPHVVEPFTLADATETQLPVPGVADGRLSGGVGPDTFLFTGRRGHKLSIDGLARRIDSRATLVLRLLDAAGRLVDESRASGASDPRLDVVLPVDGEYRLVVDDALHGTGVEYVYEIRVSDAPRLTFVFPPVVPPGAAIDAVAYGWNLPGGQPSGLSSDGRPLEKLNVRLSMPGDITDRLIYSERLEPWQFGLDGIEFRVSGPGGPSNPLLVTASRGPAIPEAAGNDTPQSAQPLTLPAEVFGQFHPRRDIDWYRFDARAGEEYWIEVWSHRLGVPTDVTLVVQQVTLADDGTEKVATVATVDDASLRHGGREFDQRSFDPAYRFKAPADGTYRLLLRDGYSQQHDDPRLVYRLAVHPPRPDFRIVAVPVDTSGAILMRKGGRSAIEVIADRWDGFAGDITLSAQGLPGGVTAGDVVLGSGVSMTRIVLTADPAAPVATGMVRIVGRSATPAGELTRIARVGTSLDPLPFVQPGGQLASTRARLTEGLAVSVSADEAAPVAVSLGGNAPLETSRGGVVKIPYAVTRKEGATAALTGFPIGLPPNVTAQQVAIGGGNAGEFEVRLAANAPSGTYSFHLATMQQGLTYARNPAAAVTAKERADAFAAVLVATQAKLQTVQQAAQQAAAAVSAASGGNDQAAKNTAGEAKKVADMAVQEAQKLLQLAQTEKQKRDQRAQQQQQQSAPKAVNIVVPSTAVTIRIAEYPLRVKDLP
ncbi:MAG: PPC domain-containing protein, partial [Planctomycetaceae bacterium]